MRDSTPSRRFFQSASTEFAPGKRPLIPTIAMSVRPLCSANRPVAMLFLSRVALVRTAGARGAASDSEGPAAPRLDSAPARVPRGAGAAVRLSTSTASVATVGAS